MDRRYVQVGGTGLLLTALVAGVAGLESKSSTAVKLQKITLVPEKKEDGSLDNLVNIDSTEICAIANSSPSDDYLFRLFSLISDDGKPLFSCEEKLVLHHEGIDIGYIEELSELKSLTGKRFFTGEDIIAYHQAKGTFDYAEKFASVYDAEGEFMFRGEQMAQLYALGVTIDEMLDFEDTSKPNALLIYPAKDNKYGTFRNSDVVVFYNTVKEGYDVMIKVAAREQEVYEALDSTKNVELLVISGHGTDDSLSLGNGYQFKGVGEDETHFLDISDRELGMHLQHLKPSATIFLYSCSTGGGREMGKNLANAIADWAQGRTVIAPAKDLETDDVIVHKVFPFEVMLYYDLQKFDFQIKKLFPLEMTFSFEKSKEDITYVISEQ